MSMLDRLRELMRLVQAHPGTPADPDYAHHRQHILACFERAAAVQDLELAQQLDAKYRYLIRNENLEVLLYELHWRLPVAAELQESGIIAKALIDAGSEQSIWMSLGENEPLSEVFQKTVKQLGLSRFRMALFRELTRDGYEHARQRYWLTWLALRYYAEEITLLQPQNGSLVVTPIGEAFLRFAGRDAIRCLVNLESLQSTGVDDPWRMSGQTAAYLVAHPEGFLSDDDFNANCIARMAEFDLIWRQEVVDGYHYRLSEPGRELLEEIVAGTETPFRFMARALLDDQAGALAMAPRSFAAHSASSTVARQTRIFAHEIRNKLAPIRTSFNQIRQGIQSSERGQELDIAMSRVSTGIEQLFGFLSEALELARHLTQPPEPFSVHAATRDAVSAIRREGAAERIETIEIYVTPSDLDPMALGYRARFTLAMVNILRNAGQVVNTHDIEVRITIAEAGDEIRITIDDDGPGVPLEQRQSIFANGVTHRKGGSGHGLSAARLIIEEEMRGSIHCEDSPQGGARFSIVVPLYRGGTS